MARYFARPSRAARGWVEDDLYDDDAPMIPSLEVGDHDAIDTGLLDLGGNSIMRAPNPMGFGRDDEW